MRLNRADEIKMREIAEKHGLTFEDVNAMVSSQYEFIRSKTKELVIPENLDKEEFSGIKTNFNIPSLCKMYASHYIYRKINEKKIKKGLDLKDK